MRALRLGRTQERSQPGGSRIRRRFATQIFEGRTLEREDTRRDYGERRFIAIGMAHKISLTVLYTDRAENGIEVVRRIISARVSHRHERNAYKAAIAEN